MASSEKRAELVETAVKLAHEQGFHRTTLADIARDSGVPLGNVYYYFKTKDALGEALVDRLADTYRSMCEAWDREPDPRKRLEAFIGLTVDSRESLARSGCPIGTLCAELHKHDGPLARRAGGLFEMLLDWLSVQFRALGKGKESRDLAAHLLSSLQGASLLAHTFHEPSYVPRETKILKTWVRSL
jgi:TetR/AcrR family transcriptional regulator, transcriptional repressor for nem operon